MISRFRKIADGVYRGSAPSPKDVAILKEKLGIKKIISLDEAAGEKITRACQLLGIKQEKLYLDFSRKSLLNLFKHNLKDLLIKGGPTYIHCLHGKDRTGLLSAIFKCKYMGMNPNDAIAEAKSLGFGQGVDPKIVSLYEKLIRSCKSHKDINNADIVSNERDYVGDNRDSVLTDAQQGSFAPYLSEVRQYPYDQVYNPLNDQPGTRENYQEKYNLSENQVSIPDVGQYDNGAGLFGTGPVFPAGGFLSD